MLGVCTMAQEGTGSNTDDIEASIVEYFYERQLSGHKCGYCGSKDTFVTNGMWAHRLAGQDYQDLIDRGWRRSGKYLYKPVMSRTCCPLYAIRCEATKYKPSRSQKKVARKMRAFLVDGTFKELPTPAVHNKQKLHDDSNNDEELPQEVKKETCEPKEEVMEKTCEPKEEVMEKTCAPKEQVMEETCAPKEQVMEETCAPKRKEDESKESGEELKETDSEAKTKASEAECDSTSVTKANCTAVPQNETSSPDTKTIRKRKTPRQGAGADPNKPRCRKAKEMRQEMKKKRLGLSEDPEAKVKDKSKDDKAEDQMVVNDDMSTSVDNTQIEPKQKEPDKTTQTLVMIEELLKIPSDRKLAHTLETKMVQCYPHSQEFTSTFIESYMLYKKYQVLVHGDKEEELSERSFRRFLCDTPLISLDGPRGWENKYGTFHCHYYVDGRLIMVAVMDILPTYLSSVYVYYDPDYRWLDLGVYSAMKEIELVQKLNHSKPEFQYYCMGYYVHNNPKMNYKGNFMPSYLLCPETYRYAPINAARLRLDEKKCCRLNDEPPEVERVLSFLGGVLILFEKQVIPYMLFRSYYGHVKDRIVIEYASLAGKEVTQRMFLYLTLDDHDTHQDEDSDD